MRDHEPGSDQAGAVDLSGLRVLRRYALALRQAEAEPAEVLALLRDDLALLESAVDVAAPAAAPPSAP
ncbi:MAG TPA: hypothetical protein VHC23_05595, partial [Jatrophihabitans sp.]|nr:hypothetical protein [Jatrophihabitans sp.]